MNAVVEQIFPSLTWRIRHEVMYPDHPLDFVKLENDFGGMHFGLYLNHELTGVVSLFINGEEAQFRKLAVLQKEQGKGLGKQLMEYLIDFCKAQHIKLLWCNARVNAQDFYFKLGFTPTNQTYTAAGYDFVRLELKLQNLGNPVSNNMEHITKL
jgi:GNAT superfamily N-acetyltransferase